MPIGGSTVTIISQADPTKTQSAVVTLDRKSTRLNSSH